MGRVRDRPMFFWELRCVPRHGANGAISGGKSLPGQGQHHSSSARTNVGTGKPPSLCLFCSQTQPLVENYDREVLSILTSSFSLAHLLFSYLVCVLFLGTQSGAEENQTECHLSS